MSDFGQFSQRMRVLSKNVEVNSKKLVKDLALNIQPAVVIATPVDEGVAKSNWIVNPGDAVDHVIPAYVPGEKGSTESENVAAAIEQGQSALSNYIDGPIHVTNNLPYIQRLNDGYSKQAGEHFVEAAIMDVVKPTIAKAGLLNDN